MEKIKILTRSEYDHECSLVTHIGHDVILNPVFEIEINLRKKIQDEIWGDDPEKVENRHRFFLWIWERKQHICEETGAYLGEKMQADFMSHILSRGAHIEMWNDPRNINILSPDSHRKWETGKKEKMKIWDKNKEIIRTLKIEYSRYKPYNTFAK